MYFKARLWGIEVHCIQWIVLLFNNMAIGKLIKSLSGGKNTSCSACHCKYCPCPLW